MNLYIVIFKFYVDDYKGCDVRFYYTLFKDINKATLYQNQELKHYIEDEINHYDIEIGKKFKKYFEIKDDKVSILKKYKNNENILEKLYEEYCKGEFVNYKFTYEIDSCKIFDEEDDEK
jgi:hypothetical protein